MKTMIRIIRTSGLAVAVIACGAAVRADDRSVSALFRTESVTVEYADLDLSRAAGIDSLYSRLRIAASEVCAPRPRFKETSMQRDWKRCFEAALDNAVTRAGNAALAQVHFHETGRQVYPDERLAGSH